MRSRVIVIASVIAIVSIVMVASYVVPACLSAQNIEGAPVAKIVRSHHDIICSVAFSPNGKFLASGSFDGVTRIWDVATGKMHSEMRMPNVAVLSLAFSPDSKILASGWSDWRVRLWNIDKKRLERTLGKMKGRAVAVGFSRSGRSLMALGVDIYLWQVGHWGLKMHERLIELAGYCASFSPTDETVALGGGDEIGELVLWNTNSGDHIRLDGHGRGVKSVAFSEDGKVLATGDADGVILIWDREHATVTRTLTEPTMRGTFVWSLSFYPDGKLLAAGSNDGRIRFWNMRTFKIDGSFDVENRFICKAVFAPDGKTIAITSGNKFDLWDVDALIK